MGKIEDAKDTILHQFINLYWSANMIAEELGVSREGIIKALREWGVETSKAAVGMVTMKCCYVKCGREYKTYRNIARKKLAENTPNFCSHECWLKWQRQQTS